jgi:hypothetical protein
MWPGFLLGGADLEGWRARPAVSSVEVCQSPTLHLFVARCCLFLYSVNTLASIMTGRRD